LSSSLRRVIAGAAAAGENKNKNLIPYQEE